MPRSRNSSQCQGTLTPFPRLFQKTPITILEELFPQQAVYSWAIARNVGCADLFRCRVNIPMKTNGEGIAFSKKAAKHQAALAALKNWGLQYVCCGSQLLQSELDDEFNGNTFVNNRRGRSLSRNAAHHISRTRSRSNRRAPRNQRSRSYSRSRSRSAIRNVDHKWNSKR